MMDRAHLVLSIGRPVISNSSLQVSYFCSNLSFSFPDAMSWTRSTISKTWTPWPSKSATYNESLVWSRPFLLKALRLDFLFTLSAIYSRLKLVVSPVNVKDAWPIIHRSTWSCPFAKWFNMFPLCS